MVRAVLNVNSRKDRATRRERPSPPPHADWSLSAALRQPNRLSLTRERGAILCTLLMLVPVLRYG